MQQRLDAEAADRKAKRDRIARKQEEAQRKADKKAELEAQKAKKDRERNIAVQRRTDQYRREYGDSINGEPVEVAARRAVEREERLFENNPHLRPSAADEALATVGSVFEQVAQAAEALGGAQATISKRLFDAAVQELAAYISRRLSLFIGLGEAGKAFTDGLRDIIVLVIEWQIKQYQALTPANMKKALDASLQLLKDLFASVSGIASSIFSDPEQALSDAADGSTVIIENVIKVVDFLTTWENYEKAGLRQLEIERAILLGIFAILKDHFDEFIHASDDRRMEMIGRMIGEIAIFLAGTVSCASVASNTSRAPKFIKILRELGDLMGIINKGPAGGALGKLGQLGDIPVDASVKEIVEAIADIFKAKPAAISEEVLEAADGTIADIITHGPVDEANAAAEAAQDAEKVLADQHTAAIVEESATTKAAQDSIPPTTPKEAPPPPSPASEIAEQAEGPKSGLVHLTDDAAAAQITSSGQLKGNIYAGPASNAELSGASLTARTGLPPGNYQSITIPAAGEAAFSKPIPIGPFTTWQRITGQQFTPRGVLDINSGVFTRQGVNWNQAGWYATDAAIGAGVGTAIYLRTRDE